MRECPFCGRYVAEQLRQCPFCRETLPPIVKSHVGGPEKERGKRHLRQGLLYMLLAAMFDYFAGGYSGLQLPFNIIPMVTQYLLPLLFLGGAGLTLWGVYRWVFA